VLLVVLMLVATPASEVIAQQKPEKPVRKEPQPPAQRPEPAEPTKPADEPQTCCRVCTKGKACGDSCIQRRLTCHKPPGCACNRNAN
jgi:hypothetical protein